MKSLHEILNTNTLKPLFEKATKLLELNLTWRHLVAGNLADYSQIASFEDGKLVIQVNNAAIATRLRFELPEIKKKLIILPEFTGLHTIRYLIVCPPLTRDNIPVKKEAIPSNIYKMWAETAENIQDPTLKTALLRLTRHNHKE